MILVVEDDVITRVAVADCLRHHGHRVLEAADGSEALTMLNQHRFNLIITDLVVPKVSGMQLIPQIRTKWPDVPIVITSGYVSEKVSKQLWKAEFLEKPIRSEILLSTVNRLIPTNAALRPNKPL